MDPQVAAPVEELPTMARARTGASVAVDAAASVAARIVAMAASSITAIVVVASLDKHQYGAYALAAGLAGVVAVALDAGMTSSVARYLAQGRGSARLVAQVMSLRIGILLVGGLVVAALGALGVIRGPFGSLLGASGALVLALGAVSFLYGALPSMRRIRLLLVVTVVQPVIELAAVLAVQARGGEAESMLLASAAAAAIAVAIGYGALALRPDRIAPHVTSVATTASLGDVLRYGRQLFAVLLLMMVFGQLDQFVIQAFHGEADVAPYALVIKLQALVIAPAVTATSIIAPRIAGAGAGALAMYRRWMAFFVILYVGAVGVFGVLAGDVFTAINPAYADDRGILLALLTFLLLSALATLPSVTLNQTGHAASRLRIASVALTINVIVDLALVPVIGAYGAALGSTLAFAWYAWRHHALVERSLRLQLDGAPVVRTAPAIGAGIVLSLGMMLLALLLRELVEHVAPGAGRAASVSVVLVGVGVPALLHLAGTTLLVRRIH